MSAALRIHALPVEVAAAVRAGRGDDLGNRDLRPVVCDSHPGFPCRVCLEDAAIGERLLLFSYSPFAAAAPYRAIGPIFVHERACTPFAWRGEVPELLRRRLLSVRAMDGAGRMVAADVCPGAELDDLAGRLLADDAVAELHVHNARPGCFACRITRA
jgi:hypothetical protein